MLAPFFTPNTTEAGVDEAGRGCLAGPVVAAAVVLPPGFYHPLLHDSKQVSEANRNLLRTILEKEALAWQVVMVPPQTIDRINILQATYQAMHEAIGGLSITPRHLLIDGNRFRPYPGIPHTCLVQGDARFAPIAAASILAKTHRDAYMKELHTAYPQYDWQQNKGYGTAAHTAAIAQHGYSPHHRKSFTLRSLQPRLL